MSRDIGRLVYMKSQDIGLLFKLTCLQMQEEGSYRQFEKSGWQDWDSERDNIQDPELFGIFHPTNYSDNTVVERYSVRALAHVTGISKSQVSLALQRCIDVGLARRDRKLGVPRTNTKALFEFVVYGLRYVFPAKLGTVTRGIATSLSAPVLEGQLMSTGEFVPVWSDARGKTKGQAVEPLFKTATYAVRRDAELYALLALVDAIRLGQPRERNMAIELLQHRLDVIK